MSLKSLYKLIFLDNDGTLNTERSTWEYFHRHLGTWESVGKALEEAILRDRTPYDEFARQSVASWKGIPKSKFMERLRTINIRDGALEVISAIKDSGLKIAVLSSGFSLWKDIWRERGVEWDYYYANDLIFDKNDISTGEIEMKVTDNVPGLDKGTLVGKIQKLEGLKKEETIFIGDGWGDVTGFKKCAFGIAIDPNMDEVKQAAKYVLRADEFRKVLDIIFGN